MGWERSGVPFGASEVRHVYYTESGYVKHAGRHTGLKCRRKSSPDRKIRELSVYIWH